MWFIFAVDYAIRLWIAEDRWHFFSHNLIDLAAVTLAALRPLRLMAALALIQKHGGARLRGHVVTYVTVSTPLVMAISGLAVSNVQNLWMVFGEVT